MAFSSFLGLCVFGFGALIDFGIFFLCCLEVLLIFLVILAVTFALSFVSLSLLVVFLTAGLSCFAFDLGFDFDSCFAVAFCVFF